MVQIQALERTNDPLYELGYVFGGNRLNTRFWVQTAENLARHFGVVDPEVGSQVVCVDRRRQWRKAGNLAKNAAIRTFVWTLGTPVRWLRRPFTPAARRRPVTPRAAVPLALGLWGLAAGLLVAAMVLGPWLLLGYVGFQVVLSLAFTSVGAFLAGRRPGNAVGWLLLGWGMVMAFSAFTGAYVERGLVRDPGRYRPRVGKGLGRGGDLASPRSGCWPSCCCCSPTAGCRRGAGGPSPGSRWPST